METRNSSALFKIQSDRGQKPLPPPCAFPPNVPDKDFEIAILLIILQRSVNKISGVNTTPRGGGGAGFISYALKAYLVVMGEVLV